MKSSKLRANAKKVLGSLAKTGVGVEKLRDRNVFLAASIAAAEFFLSRLN
jgi:hypothetical protein